MGKTGKWIRHFLTGKKDKEKKENCHTNPNSTISVENLSTPIAVAPNTSKEKRRWSFRRSSAAAPAPKGANPEETNGTTEPQVPTALDSEDEKKKHAMAMKAATAAAADAALAAAQAAAAVIRLTATVKGRASAIEEAAAIKIQSVFRSYLARKALCALRGLVKLQALVRGHLVRKQATATLRCMQALVTVQARARAQRILAVEDVNPACQRPSVHRKSTQEHRIRQANYDFDREEKIKIVEMDLGEPKGTRGRNSYSHHPQQQSERVDLRFSMLCTPKYNYSNPENYQASPDPSAIADMSPRTCSGHFEDYSFGTTQSSPQHYSAASKTDPTRVPFALPQPDYTETVSYDYPLFPNYMSNTESSRAKVRSQSAPKSRPEFERQPSRRRPSMEGRNIPRAVRMQRSSSHAGATAQNYQFPWHLKLDRSSVSSVKDSEYGSIRTVLTNAEYCRSLVGFDNADSRKQALK